MKLKQNNIKSSFKGGSYMKLVTKIFSLVLVVTLLFITILFSAEQKAKSKKGGVVVVGLYSETEEGAHVSYRVGTGEWIVVKLGDIIPTNAEIKVSVEWDWVEVIPANNPNVVYEITGSEKGDVIKKVSNLLKENGRKVTFPKAGSKNINPTLKNKLVVKKYLGRHIYIAPDGSESDIKYGDKLDVKGKVNMIAINTTLDLMFPNGKVVTVIGPIKFDVEKLYKGEKIYKMLNITK